MIFGKKVSNLRASVDVEGCGSEGSCCTISWPWGSYMYRSYAEFWFLMILLLPSPSSHFSSPTLILLLPDSRLHSDNGGEIHRDHSPRNIKKLFLSSPSPSPRALFNLIPKMRLHFRGMNGRDSRTRGRRRVETIKQFPTVRDAIYRTVMASEENPTAIKWSATGVFYGRKKNVVTSSSACRPEVLRLSISHVAKLNRWFNYYSSIR